METLQNLTSELSLSNSSHLCMCVSAGGRTPCLRTLQLHVQTESGMNNSNIFSYISLCLSVHHQSHLL